MKTKTAWLLSAAMGFMAFSGCIDEQPRFRHNYHSGDMPCMRLGGRQVTVLEAYEYSDFLVIRQKDFSESGVVHEFELEPCK